MKLVLFILLFFATGTLAAPPNWDEWDDKMWLVHATPIRLKKSMVVASAMDLNSPKRIASDDDYIHYRMTLHTCLGGIAPDSTMVTDTKLMGVSIPTPLKESMNKRPYIYMAPWKDCEGQIIGGTPFDTMLFGNYRFGPGSTLLISKEEEQAFREENPNFEGTAIFYDPKKEKVSDLVKQHLKEREAWTIDFKGDKGNPDAQICINGEHVNREKLLGLFRKKVPYVGLHNNSPFRFQEEFLKPFAIPFVAISRGLEKLDNSFVPERYARVLRTLIDLNFAELKGIVTQLNPDCRKAFQGWEEDTYAWLRLYDHMESALQEEKEINGPLLKKLPSMRTDERAIKYAFDDLHTPEKTPPFSKYIRSEGFQLFPPECLQDLWLLPAHCLGSLWRGVEETQEQELLAQLMALFALNHTLKYSKQPSPESEEYLNLLEKALPHMGALSAQTASHFDHMIISALLADTENEVTVFKALSHPHMSTLLAIMYNAPEFSEKESLCFQDILPFTLATRDLYSDEHAKRYKHVLFIRHKLLSNDPQSFSDAYEAQILFQKFASELRDVSLTKAIIQNMAFLGFEAAFGIKAETIPPPPEPPALAMLKNGEFGTLDEIFGFYDLKEEFRSRFPEDKDLWEYPNSLTLGGLLLILESDRSSN